jgi:hypothetical protein
MKKVHLLSTAAALLLTVGAASAQGMKKDEAPGRAPAAQQNAPAEKIAPAQKSAPALKSERKTHETTGQASRKEHETTGQAPSKEPENHMGKEKSHMGKDSQMNKSGEGKASQMNKSGESRAQGEIKSKSNESATKERNSTTGQGAAASSGKLSTEQRTKITTVFRQHKVTPAHLNVSVSVGTRVPESVHFYPLPREVVVIYPEWRGYDYIMVGDQILVINPRSHEIVAILEA